MDEKKVTYKLEASVHRSGGRDTTSNQGSEMEDFSKFCQRALIAANIICLVKSTELTFLGGSLYVLEPALAQIVGDITVHAKHLDSEITIMASVRLTARFLLIVGPVLLVVGTVGLCGAYRKSTGFLLFYLGLLVILVTVIIVLSSVGIPTALVDPEKTWLPLSDFLLAVIVISLAMQGLLIFLTIVVLTAISNENQNRVHPHNDPKMPNMDKTPRSVRRRSRYE